MPVRLAPTRIRLAAESLCRRAPCSSSLSKRLLPTRQHPSSACPARPISTSTPTAISNTSSTSTPHTTLTSTPPAPPSRWIAELRARVGKCIVFGCSDAQLAQAAAVMRAVATEWRALLAGSEGFLSGGRRGIEGREVVWGEMDTFGHVNNVNYYRYAESARVNWITNFAVHVDPAHRQQWGELMTPRSTGLIMRSLKADFKFPMVYPDKISVYHKLRCRPEGDPAPSFFMLDCIVLSHQHRRVSARLEEDIVVYDYKAAGKTSMPGYMVELFNKTWEMQQRETVRARTRIWELIGTVEKLEKGTWDRADAVEDLGSAKSSA